jgi:hypothetical protein
MRLTLALFTILAGTPALAHIGHLADVAGHGHWAAAGAAAGAIAIALGIAALGARKGKSQDKDVTEDDATDEEGALA